MSSGSMTSTQAAAYLGVSRQMLRRWADAGRVPCYRTPGGHRRSARADIVAMAATRRPGEGWSDPVAAWTEVVGAALSDAIAALGPEQGALLVRMRDELRGDA